MPQENGLLEMEGLSLIHICSLSQEAVAALSSFEEKTSAQNAEEGLTNE